MALTKKQRDAMTSSESVEWETPPRFFKELDREFHFTRDVCASRINHKLDSFWDKEDNALDGRKWEGTLWMNPPYGRDMGMWLKKAYESRATATTVCLIPARTDTKFWHQWVMKADEIRFVKGRLKFVNAEDGALFPSCVVIFNQQH